LLHPEVEVGRSLTTGCAASGCSLPSGVLVIAIVIVVVIVVVVVLLVDLNFVSSGKGHFSPCFFNLVFLKKQLIS